MEKNNKKRIRKRTTWTEGAERHLLKLWEKHVPDLRKPQRSGQVFSEIAKDLAKGGFEVTCNEVQMKVHYFSKRFRKEQQNIELTGASSSEWKYFYLIKEILRHSPLHNTNSLVCDSITDQGSSSNNCVLLSPSDKLSIAPSPLLLDPLSPSIDSDCSTIAKKKIKLNDDNVLVPSAARSIPRKCSSLHTIKSHLPLKTRIHHRDKFLQKIKKLNEISKKHMEWQKEMDVAYQQIMHRNEELLRRMMEAMKRIDERNIRDDKKQKNKNTSNETSNIMVSTKKEEFEIVYENMPTEVISNQISDETAITIVKTEYDEFEIINETMSSSERSNSVLDETHITAVKTEDEELESINDNHILDKTPITIAKREKNESKNFLSREQEKCFPVLLTKSTL